MNVTLESKLPLFISLTYKCTLDYAIIFCMKRADHNLSQSIYSKHSEDSESQIQATVARPGIQTGNGLYDFYQHSNEVCTKNSSV